MYALKMTNMPSSIELLSTEVLFEIFDYLTPFDTLHAFINLTERFNAIVGLYPLRLDFQSISRAKFDFICRHIQPKQITGMILSDERMPHQCELFKRHFPRFQNQFTRLKTIKFNNTSTILPSLPPGLTSLSIETYLKASSTDSLVTQVLIQHAPSLTHLRVEGSYVFRSLTRPFSSLTHLTVDYCISTHFQCLVPYLPPSVTYLKLFLDKDEECSTIQFGHLSNSLTQLILTLSHGKPIRGRPTQTVLRSILEMHMSFELMKQCLQPLTNLRYLTLQATGTLDLMDGQLWEEYLSRTSVRRFNFKFMLGSAFTCDEEPATLLQSFRSSFWQTKHRWYVACEKGQFRSNRLSLYSIPYFQSSLVFHPSKHFRPLTTANEGLIKQHAINLIITCYRTIPTPERPFVRVQALTLLTSTLPSIDILRTMVHLQEIPEIDISLIRHVPIDELLTLLDQMSQLHHIQMQFHPQFLPPLHIDSYTIIHNDEQMFVLDTQNVERFCHLFFHVRYLDISVQSEDVIILLLKRLHYLELTKILCYQDSLIDIGYRWFLQHVPRLATMQFSYRVTANHLVLSIGDTKVSGGLH